MNLPRSRRGGSARPAPPRELAERERRQPSAGPSLAWRTQDRISRCRGLGYCVIEVHEFDPERPQARPAIEYRVYHEAHGFPVGAAIGCFSSRHAAQCRAETLGAGASREES